MGLKRLPALSVPGDAARAGASFVSSRELFARRAVCRDAALSPCINRGETWSRNGTLQTPHRAAPLRRQAEGLGAALLQPGCAGNNRVPRFRRPRIHLHHAADRGPGGGSAFRSKRQPARLQLIIQALPRFVKPCGQAASLDVPRQQRQRWAQRESPECCREVPVALSCLSARGCVGEVRALRSRSFRIKAMGVSPCAGLPRFSATFFFFPLVNSNKVLLASSCREVSQYREVIWMRFFSGKKRNQCELPGW